MEKLSTNLLTVEDSSLREEEIGFIFINDCAKFSQQYWTEGAKDSDDHSLFASIIGFMESESAEQKLSALLIMGGTFGIMF